MYTSRVTEMENVHVSFEGHEYNGHRPEKLLIFWAFNICLIFVEY